MYIKIDINDEVRERAIKYANEFGLKMPRAYADLLNIALEVVEAGADLTDITENKKQGQEKNV